MASPSISLTRLAESRVAWGHDGVFPKRTLFWSQPWRHFQLAVKDAISMKRKSIQLEAPLNRYKRQIEINRINM